MSNPKTAIPTGGDLNLFCLRILKVQYPEDVLEIIAALEESSAGIDAQRVMRQRDGTATPGWLQASASALKYCGLKLKAARDHYKRLIDGKPPEEFTPAEAWLVTFCNNANGDITTQVSNKHPAELFLDHLEAAPPEERENISLVNSIKIHPSQVTRAVKLMAPATEPS